MLIKSSRIRASSGAGALLKHLADGMDNEAVVTIQGVAADLTDAVADARKFGRSYALRHFIVAPQLSIDRNQFRACVSALAAEFGFDPAAVFVVEHQKQRVVEGVADKHWHVIVPEVDPATGRVLSNRHDHLRHEKVARTLEVLFSHPMVPGRHDKAVLAALRAEGRYDVADRLSASPVTSERPTEAFTTTEHQAAKRQGIDLALLKVHVADAWKASASGDEIIRRLAEHGMTVESGSKPGVWVVHAGDGVFVGSGHRLAQVRKAEFNQKLESRNDYTTHQCSPGDPLKHKQDQDRYRHDPSTRANNDRPNARAGSELYDHGNRAVAGDRVRDRADAAQCVRTSREIRGTGHSVGVAAHDERGLITAVLVAAKACAGMIVSGIDLPYLTRATEHLDGLDKAAHAEIAAAGHMAEPSRQKLDVSILYKNGTGKTLDEMHAYLRELEAMPEPKRPGLISRLLGGAPDNGDALATKAQIKIDHLRSQIIGAERAWLGAVAGVAKAEKDYRAACTFQQGQIEQNTRAAKELLTQVRLSRQIVLAYPRFAFCSPKFIYWAGRRIERHQRRRLSNSMKKNIWGLPIEP